MRKSQAIILTVLYMALFSNIAKANNGTPDPGTQQQMQCCPGDKKNCKVTEPRRSSDNLTLNGVGTALLNKRTGCKQLNNNNNAAEKEANLPPTDDGYPGLFILHSIMRF